MHRDILKILKKQIKDCDCGTQMRFVNNFILLGWHFNHKVVGLILLEFILVNVICKCKNLLPLFY